MALKYNDGREPSSRNLKVQRGVRIFASTYLQDNLLTLPALPTREKLNKIRNEKEREAEERRKEIERQLEEQRRCELLRIQEEEAAASAARKAVLFDKPAPTDANPLSMRSIEGHFNKLSSEFSTFSIEGRLSKFSSDVKRSFLREESQKKQTKGWAVESGRHRHDSIDDPFEVQRQQLTEYLEQAKIAGRADEVAAIQESLRDIEAEIEMRET